MLEIEPRGIDFDVITGTRVVITGTRNVKNGIITREIIELDVRIVITEQFGLTNEPGRLIVTACKIVIETGNRKVCDD